MNAAFDVWMGNWFNGWVLVAMVIISPLTFLFVVKFSQAIFFLLGNLVLIVKAAFACLGEIINGVFHFFFKKNAPFFLMGSLTVSLFWATLFLGLKSEIANWPQWPAFLSQTVTMISGLATILVWRPE